MQLLSTISQLFSRPSYTSADEPAASAPPAAHGDDEVNEPAKDPGLRYSRKRPCRGRGGGGDIVVVDDHDNAPPASTLTRPLYASPRTAFDSELPFPNSYAHSSATPALSPLQDMRRPGDTSDERRLFPNYGRPNGGVPITPGQTFSAAKSRVQKYAFQPLDRISRRGFKESGPVRVSGEPRLRRDQQSSPVSQHPLASPTLRDDDNKVVKRQRNSPNQIINLLDDEVPTAPLPARDENSRPLRSPSVVSVEPVETKNEKGRDDQEASVRSREPARASVARLNGNSGGKQDGIRNPGSAVGGKRLGSPLHYERDIKSNRSHRDRDTINSTVEDGESQFPVDTTDQTHEETRSASRNSRRDSNASESPDELQRGFSAPGGPFSRHIRRGHIGIDVRSNPSHEEVTRRPNRKDSPSDIQPTVFGLPRKVQKKQQNDTKPTRSHRHLFEVKFFRYGDVKLDDQDLQLSLDEETDSIGLLSTEDYASTERIPVHRVSSMFQGSDGSLKVRFRLCKTEGSLDQSVDVEFGNQQDKTRLCDLLQRKGVTSQGKGGSWMDKAFNNVLKMAPSRQASARVKEPTTKDVVELAPEPSKQPEEEPVKRQKLSASLQDENNTQSGLKLPPRRLPLQIQSPTWLPMKNVRSHSKEEENQAVDIPVKTSNSYLKGRDTRSKVRQSLVDLIDDEPDPTVDGIPSSPAKLSKTLVYPPEGRKKAEVDSSDIERLRDGEFLNDNLIGFYLRFLEHHLEQNNPDVSKRVYFFNSYFFDTLTSPAKGKRGINYGGVQKWTRNVDLFSHDYVIVPINESAHWYLAIICNLTSLTKSKEDNAQPAEPEPGAQPEPSSESLRILPKQVEEIPETPPERAATPEQAARESLASMKITDYLPSSQQKEHHNSQGDRPEKEENQLSHPVEFRNSEPSAITEQRNKDAGEKKKSKRKGPILSADQPTIVTFDSLGAARQPAIKILRTYLLEEAVSKRSLNVDAKDIKGMTAKEIPLQPNFSDCGLYLLAYMEKFVQDPDTFVRNLLQKQMSADDDWPALKSGLLRRRLRSFLFKLQEEQDGSGEGKLVGAQPISYLLGPSSAGVDRNVEPVQSAPSTGPEAVPETHQEETGDVQPESPAKELGETEVIQETQLSGLQKADTTGEAQEDPKKADSETAQPAVGNQDDEDVVEVIEQPETPKPKVTTRSGKSSPKNHSSPKSLRKEKTKHPLSVATPEKSKDKQANPDNLWDEMLDFISTDAPPTNLKMEVQVPKVQVPGTPPSAKKARKAVQSPRQSKSRKRDI
ncbi:Sentrin-specific protease 6 [Talaromyces islandicus]|uniref:Sentrin-specific protease 6 n=1 Tax=Talaromyces islandicus TaxID=28573 RepID=A0A0U1LVI7_TALIS|nr:Sentrin-specific protease 6 [Talaromyces islandicus]